MDFYIERRRVDNTLEEVISFRGEVREGDLIKLRFDDFDRGLLDSISFADSAPADYLLALEMLFRRHAEQTPGDAIPGGCDCVTCTCQPDE